MRLEDILHRLDPVAVHGATDVLLEGVTYDSRRVRPGWAFVAIRGEHHDGAAFINDALATGATLVVTGLGVEMPSLAATHAEVHEPRAALARLAAAVYDDPSRRLQVFGVTGTNGKTSVAYMIRDILKAAGRMPGLLGTVMHDLGGRTIPAMRTTPEASDLQEMLAEMVSSGCQAVAMEVSSHALDQGRVDGIAFDVGVFTNLTPEHLDYHGDMDRYFDAKAKLFSQLAGGPEPGIAVLGTDDAWARKLSASLPRGTELLTFGTDGDADVTARDIEATVEGSAFMAHTPWGEAEIHIRLPGLFNVRNALAAIAACGAKGISLKTITGVLAVTEPAPGRLEPLASRRGFNVFVDYAHTPDALENVLRTLRPLTHQRLIVVFGCGGNRDQSKRPVMGEIAARLADHVVLTSDNPRREDPQAILDDIVTGLPADGSWEMEPDRERAMERALALAGEGDTVLVAGKGHEDYQEIQDTRIPFDDRQVLRSLLTTDH